MWAMTWLVACGWTVDEDGEDSSLHDSRGPTKDPCEPQLFFADTDGDGFGDAGEPVEACEAPEGTVTDAGDCDDTDANVHPGADELCNGLDDDCDLTVDEGCPLPESWVKNFHDGWCGTDDLEEVGTVLAGLGDVSGDGQLDVALGGADGTTYVIDALDPSGGAAELSLAELVGTQGAPLAARGVGDVDGDGAFDIVTWQLDQSARRRHRRCRGRLTARGPGHQRGHPRLPWPHRL